jgi:hypothetical protein
MKRTTAFVLALLLAGCGLTRPPEVNVEDQWADAMRRLGMFSVYPATEDVLPGDIYLLVPPPYGVGAWTERQYEAIVPGVSPGFDSRRFSLLRLGSLAIERPQAARARPLGTMSLREHIEEQQRERPRIQPLPSASTEFVATQPQGARRPRIDTPAGTPGQTYAIGGADQNVIATRLQRSAIPSLTVARVTETQLGAAGILGNFAANLVGSAGGEVGLTIALRDVQELTVEPWRARSLLDAIGPAVFDQRVMPGDLLYWLQVLRVGRNDRYNLRDPACRGDEAALNRQGVQVAVVTRVIYAGSIEYSFSRRVSGAVRAALDLQGTLAQNIRQAPQVPAVVVNTGGTSPPPAGSGGTTPPATPGAQARDDLAGRLSALTGLTSGDGARAGVTTAFGIGTLGTLSLIEIFNRPIAVGAGSRLTMTFHEALAGPDTNRLGLRFAATEAACRALLGDSVMEAARTPLWRAMAATQDDGNVPARLPGTAAVAQRGPDPLLPDPPARTASARNAAALPVAQPDTGQIAPRQFLRNSP